MKFNESNDWMDSGMVVFDDEDMRDFRDEIISEMVKTINGFDETDLTFGDLETDEVEKFCGLIQLGACLGLDIIRWVHDDDSIDTEADNSMFTCLQLMCDIRDKHKGE